MKSKLVKVCRHFHQCVILAHLCIMSTLCPSAQPAQLYFTLLYTLHSADFSSTRTAQHMYIKQSYDQFSKSQYTARQMHSEAPHLSDLKFAAQSESTLWWKPRNLWTASEESFAKKSWPRADVATVHHRVNEKCVISETVWVSWQILKLRSWHLLKMVWVFKFYWQYLTEAVLSIMKTVVKTAPRLLEKQM